MERVMSELAGYFCKQEDLEVHLVLYGLDREIFYPIPKNLIVHRPDFAFNNRKRFWNTLKTLGFLRSKIRALQPDSILSFGEYWNNFVLLALYGLPYPVYVSDRCQPDKSLGRLHDRLRNWLYPKAAGVIAQTEQAKAIYTKMYHHPNIAVIGNPIRTIPTRRDLQREHIVLSVGRLIKSKHHDELIRLFVKVRRSGWRLVIVGDDALKQQNKIKLEALVDQLDASDYVELTGRRSDVESFYLRSSIFAFTSSSEGFPNVIGEAMASKLPVVAFDCVAGPSDMLEDGKNGFLVPLFNYKAFSDRLKELMTNEMLRSKMGNYGIESVRRFSVQTIGDKYIEFIKKR